MAFLQHNSLKKLLLFLNATLHRLHSIVCIPSSASASQSYFPKINHIVASFVAFPVISRTKVSSFLKPSQIDCAGHIHAQTPCSSLSSDGWQSELRRHVSKRSPVREFTLLDLA